MKMILSQRTAFFSFLLALNIGLANAQSVTINTDGSTADISSIFDVKSTTKGMLVPRMSTTQRMSIAAPAKGLLVYDTTANSFWYYKLTTGWVEIMATGTSNAFTLPYAATVNNSSPLFSLNSTGSGNGIEANAFGSGNGLRATVSGFGTGQAAVFENLNTFNTSNVVTVNSVGNTTGISAKIDNTNATSPAIAGEINSIYSNFGTAGIYGLSSGTGGFAGLFYQSNENGNGAGLVSLTEGNGNGITTNAGKNGNGLEANCDGTGNAIYGWIPNFGGGRAARFANFNAGNNNPVTHITNAGTGHALLINHTGPSGSLAVFQSNSSNVARIDKSGKGFFNGGTQAGGADLAEAFDVEGNTADYEPGDVLVISVTTDRAIEKSTGTYSTLVAGVYATKPGVLLTEENIDSRLTGKVPMGVVGVIPTKVCLEGGAIQRGDLLVTSSQTGVAMKADLSLVKPGQIIGKALANFDGTGIGKINVLVNVK